MAIVSWYIYITVDVIFGGIQSKIVCHIHIMRIEIVNRYL